MARRWVKTALTIKITRESVSYNESAHTFKPCIIVYGDREEQIITKGIWSLVAGQDIPILNPNTVEELAEKALEALLILIVIHAEDDPNIELARPLALQKDVVCGIVAITDDATVRQRIKVMAQGFDSIFNTSLMENRDFRRILMNKIEKGMTRLNNRAQEAEYRRFKASLAASPDAFIVFDENRKIFFVSEHYRKAYPQNGYRMVRGLDVMEAFEMCCVEQDVSEDDPRYEKMKKFWTDLTGQAEYEMDDGRIWRMKCRHLLGGMGTIVTTTDITDYVNQQRELQQKSQELAEALENEKEASAIQKQFINMVSHEFRTPLSIIDGNAQILLRRTSTLDIADIQKRSRTIRSAVSRLVTMMEGVLSSNMLKTGKLELVRENFNVKQLLYDLCDAHTDLSKNHRIETNIDSLPDSVFLDKKVTILIASNLLANAIKFSREDDPLIRVTGQMENGHINISIEDNGIGIPENELGHIFERYYRATTASGIPGTGIGLNLVKDLIDLHEGRVEIKSLVGEGTTVMFSLPSGA